jgi:hypothetical protein
MPQEKKFLEELNMFRNEVLLALKSLYTELAIREIADKNKNVLDALNYAPTFWNTILSALQHSTFITFGRIFDNNGRYSLNTLFKATKDNKNLFTKEAFAGRWVKSSDRNQIDHWLPEYLKSLYVPTDKDFLDFGKFINKQKKTYAQIYRPIRDHFGHRLYNKNEDVKVLFDKIQVKDLEKFCVELEAMHEALWQLFHNGRGPLLPIKYGKYSTRSILSKRYKIYDSLPTNAQFIEEAKTALNLLKTGLIALRKSKIF